MQDNSWHTGGGVEWTGKKGYRLEEEEGGGARAEGSAEIGDGSYITAATSEQIQLRHPCFLHAGDPELESKIHTTVLYTVV